jgi:ABC-type Na+ transport system ATPase subunit NatA
MKIYYLKDEPKDFTSIDPNSFLLIDRDFNDYGYYTLFRLIFVDSNKLKIDLGELRILNTESQDTRIVLPEKPFKKLADTYCAIGDSFEFYRELKKLKKEYYEFFLDAVNDVVRYPEIGRRFYSLEGFKKSLLRYSNTQKVYEEGNALFNEEFHTSESRFDFRFSSSLPDASGSHNVHIKLDKTSSGIPCRVMGWVGKNGTGKTQLLANLATALSGQNLNAGNFDPKRPSFDRVIAISYSVFDQFERPEPSSKFSYHYLGLRDNEGGIDLSGMKNRIREDVRTIIRRGKFNTWRESIGLIIGDDALPYESIPDNKTFALNVFGNEKLDNLSSGQLMVISVITGIVSRIEKDSLLLFDEPETHLHPNAIHSLYKSLIRILSNEDSYMIMATHSPIILQELTSDYIRVFEREGSIPIVSKPQIECFGENVSKIIDDIFRVKDEESGYRSILKSLARDMSYDDILNRFEGKLSLNARVYLKNIMSRNQ